MAQTTLFKASFLLGLVLVSLVATAPREADASLFSIVSRFFDNSVKKEETSLNSQRAPILQAVLTADPKGAQGGGDITIVGGTALLAEVGPSGTIADIQKESAGNGEISLYVVREGDSLSQIANLFGVSVNTIIWANDLKRGSLITPGQTLVILPISGVRHIVSKGDTLQSLAKKYDGDVSEIAKYNDIKLDASLEIGMEITIPNGVIQTPSVSGTKLSGTSSGLPTYSGYYLRPIAGGRKTQGVHGYNGIDLGAPTGTEILAAASGQVIISREGGWNGGYGSYVVIKHPNGTQTLYAHNSQNYVSVGAWVVQGQVIGLVGSTGRSTGPHLHFEVRGASNPF